MSPKSSSASTHLPVYAVSVHVPSTGCHVPEPGDHAAAKPSQSYWASTMRVPSSLATTSDHSICDHVTRASAQGSHVVEPSDAPWSTHVVVPE